MGKSRRRVRTLPVQLKYAVFLTLTAGFTLLVMIFVMAWFVQRNYNLFMGDELGISAQVVQIVRHEQRLLEMSLFFLFCGSIVIVFAAALYVTRKLSGPVLALERYLLAYSQGDKSREFRLRQNDEFRNLEYLINHLRANLSAADSMPILRKVSSQGEMK